MADDVFRLFDEYAARRARGERPDVQEYLARAGEGADELRVLLDRLVAATPPPEPTEDEAAAMQAWLAGEPPLLAARTRRGVKRAQIVEALMERLGLDPGKREKVAGYVHRTETGLLDPDGVDERVWEVWAEILRTRVAELAAFRPSLKPPAPAVMFRRDEAVAADRGVAADLLASEPPDEIDRLFRGG